MVILLLLFFSLPIGAMEHPSTISFKPYKIVAAKPPENPPSVTISIDATTFDRRLKTFEEKVLHNEKARFFPYLKSIYLRVKERHEKEKQAYEQKMQEFKELFELKQEQELKKMTAEEIKAVDPTYFFMFSPSQPSTLVKKVIEATCWNISSSINKSKNPSLHAKWKEISNAKNADTIDEKEKYLYIALVLSAFLDYIFVYHPSVPTIRSGIDLAATEPGMKKALDFMGHIKPSTDRRVGAHFNV